MKKALFIIGISMLRIAQVGAQGIIINEVTQGPKGAQEFLELLVVGSADQSINTVDLRDWIIDDNNGDFQLANNTAPGITSGHFRFAMNDSLSAVPIGALIVIYNVADTNPAWNFRVVNSSNVDIAHIENGGYTYYIPGNSTLLKACSGAPTSTSPLYNYTNTAVPPTSGNWGGQIGLSNSGDAVQVRKPDGSFYHGFGISTSTQSNNFLSFPIFPESNQPSFNGFSGAATGNVTYLDCGSYYFSQNYINGLSNTLESPGQPNNANNALLVNAIRNGQFNYAQLGTAIPCSEALPLTLHYFHGRLVGQTVHVFWAMSTKDNNKNIIVQRSADQKSWTDMPMYHEDNASEEAIKFEMIDKAPIEGVSFYRLLLTDQEGQNEFSHMVPIRYHKQTNHSIFLYPNPVEEDELKLIAGQQIQSFRIYDQLGRYIPLARSIYKSDENTLSLDLTALVKGYYWITIQFNNATKTLSFVRN